VRSNKKKIELPGLCYSDALIGSNHHFCLLGLFFIRSHGIWAGNPRYNCVRWFASCNLIATFKVENFAIWHKFKQSRTFSYRDYTHRIFCGKNSVVRLTKSRKKPPPRFAKWGWRPQHANLPVWQVQIRASKPQCVHSRRPPPCATTEKTEIPIDNRIFAFDTGMHACAVRSISVDRTPETGGGGGIRSVGGGNLLNDEHDPNNVTKAASSDQERITGGRWRRR
jgi:hypothetical protein